MDVIESGGSGVTRVRRGLRLALFISSACVARFSRPQLLATGLLVVGLLGPLLAQQRPTFKSGIDVARVTVRVLDKNRKPVRDLTEKDFTILLDGQPRPIVAFTTDDAEGPVAPTAPWMRDVAPDVAATTSPIRDSSSSSSMMV
jgi:hypothetical protein